MENRKKKIVIFLSMALCTVFLLSSFSITYAFLTDRENKKNSFFVGETATTILEEYIPPKVLSPGISFVKKPTVKNIGNLPCFVRMRADFSDSRMKELCEDLDINSADWEYSAADGYYYYNKILEPGKETSALFTQVTVKSQKSDGTLITQAEMLDFDILIYAESTQHIDHEENHASDEFKIIWG